MIKSVDKTGEKGYTTASCNDCGSVMRGNKHNGVSDKLVIV